MKCIHCKGTGKYKMPNDREKFEELIDLEMDKAYFVNYAMAEEKALNKVGYTIVDCPYCSQNSNSKN